MPPKIYAGLGPDNLVPRLEPDKLAELNLGAEEGFVLSRVDGKLTVGEICLLVPFDASMTVSMLVGLVHAGAIAIPGAQIPPPQKPAIAELPKQEAKAAPEPSAPRAAPPPSPPAALVSGLDLTVEQARRIDEYFGSLDRRGAYELLELGQGADKKEIKRAYFKLSKEFHPDRFFNKNIGPYKERLSKIFQSIKAAFELLSDDARRTAYEDSLKR